MSENKKYPISNIQYPIYLIGMMGVWKSTVGKLLAEQLNVGFIDTDRKIEENMSMNIGQIFQHLGEKRFREEENKVLLSTGKFNGIVSTGGGIVVTEDNRFFLSKQTTILLQARPNTLSKRIHNLKTRPLLQNSTDLINSLTEIWVEREVFFKTTAQYILETDDLNPDEIVNLIIEKLK
ncbi:MAG: shikimate kinase [Candidatus Marinimicrobia bacterium]|nr:shikimate kinase [Candidatus Neomarinimicrobiota bacterium]MBL7022888.1 shikimate kinase [Candidatus Neomarinimicrobiota bacterium]MBL7109207.1 shikimate kinase [Candidatus Neomarinimicrobiota bacterium]